MGIFSFFDRFRASSDDRSAGGDFFFEPVATRSASGMRVSADRALRLSAVYACVRILSETMASLPIVIYRQRADGGKDRVTDHWLYNLLARKPNRFQNPFEWREMLQGHLAIRGNAFCQIVSNLRGEITELMPLHPDHVRVEIMDNGDFRYRVRLQNGEETILPRGRVWHLRGLSSDGLMGMSPIELARESLGMALAAQDYGARFFRNDAKPTGGWIEFPGAFKDAEAKRIFRDSYGPASFQGNPIFPIKCLEGVKDAQAVAAGYHMSLALMNDGTVKWAGYNGQYIGGGSGASRNTWETLGAGYLTNITKLRLYGYSTYQTAVALRNDGKVVVWGFGGSGQVGNGNNLTPNAPNSYLLLDKTVIDFSVSGYFGAGGGALYCLTSDGQVMVNGYGAHSMDGDDDQESRFAPSPIIF